MEPGKRIIKYGKTQRGYQKYLCQHCNRTLIETQGTPLYDRRIPKQDIINICGLLINKNSIRSIEKKTNHHRDTINYLSEALSADPKGAEKIIFQSMKVNKSNMGDMWDTLRRNTRKK
jgi:hypothetical protein